MLNEESKDDIRISSSDISSLHIDRASVGRKTEKGNLEEKSGAGMRN